MSKGDRDRDAKPDQATQERAPSFILWQPSEPLGSSDCAKQSQDPAGNGSHPQAPSTSSVPENGADCGSHASGEPTEH
jgi:hypothetical protein